MVRLPLICAAHHDLFSACVFNELVPYLAGRLDLCRRFSFFSVLPQPKIHAAKVSEQTVILPFDTLPCH